MVLDEVERIPDLRLQCPDLQGILKEVLEEAGEGLLERVSDSWVEDEVEQLSLGDRKPLPQECHSSLDFSV